MDGAEVQLADVLTELQAVRVALQAVQAQAHADALMIVAVGLLVFGAALGLAVVVCSKRWLGGN